MSSVFSRVGAAYQAGVPFGAALGVAQNTPDDNTAAAFGPLATPPVLGGAVAAASTPATATTTVPAAAPAAHVPNKVYATWADVPRADGFWNKVGSIASNVGHVLQNAVVNADAAPGMHWIFSNANKGVEWTGNVEEANLRTMAQRVKEGKAKGGIGGLFESTVGALEHQGLGSGWLLNDQQWLANWDKSVAAQASVSQTAWLGVKSAAAGDPYIDYSLLDDPAKRQDREEYFSSGSQKWVTGIGDAVWNLTMDPVIFAGKGAAAYRASRTVLGAKDVAQASEVFGGVRDVSKASGKAKSLMGSIDDVIAAHDLAATHPGTASALAKTRLLAQTTDPGGILAEMDRVDVIFKGDTAARQAAKRTVLLAGAGDRRSLAILQQESSLLSASLHGILRPNVDAEIVDLTHLSAADKVGDVIHRVSDSVPVQNELAAQADEIARGFDALKAAESIPTADALAAADEFAKSGIRNISRVEAVGTAHAGVAAADLTPGAMGEIRSVQRTGAGRDLAAIKKTIDNGIGLRPIHLVTGIHIPQTASLAADDFPRVFQAATQRARMAFKGDPAMAKFVKNETLKLDDRMVKAASMNIDAARQQRGDILNEFNTLMEDATVSKYADAADIGDQSALRATIKDTITRRTSEARAIQDRAYQAHAAGERASITSPDGITVFDEGFGGPFAGSQMKDTTSIVDWAKMVKTVERSRLSGWKGRAVQTGEKTWAISDDILSMFNDVWKVSTLFRPIAYAIRVQGDTQMRLYSMLGAMEDGLNALKGSRNVLRNNFKTTTVGEAEFVNRQTAASATIRRIDRTLANENPSAGTVKTLTEQKTAMEKLLGEKYQPPAEALARENVKRRIKGTDLETRIGTSLDVRDPYASAAEASRGNAELSASESNASLWISNEKSQLGEFRSTGERQHVTSDAATYEQRYVDFVNRIIRNDRVGSQMLAGVDDRQILTWLKDPVNDAYVKAVAKTGQTAEDVVAKMRQQVDLALPTTESKALVSGGNITKGDIKKIFPDAADRPSVPFEVKAPVSSHASIQLFNKTRNQYFNLTSGIPETILGRHPFYVHSYRAHMQRMINNVADDAGALTNEQLGNMRKAASVLSKRDMSNIMFDLSQKSNATYSLRFLSPFYAPWADTMEKWLRITGITAGVPLIQAGKAFQGLNKAFVVTNADGNQILGNGDVVDDKGNVIGWEDPLIAGSVHIPIPDWLKKWSGAKDLKLSKGSANIIFQGDPFYLPGPGPLMSVPANEIMTMALPEMFGSNPTWASNPVGKWLLPFGTTDATVVDQFFPSWGRNLKSALEADFQDPRFAQTYAQMMAEEMRSVRKGDVSYATQGDLKAAVANKTRNWFLLKLFGSEMPVSTTPTSTLQFYKDKWNEYQRTYGLDARDKFYADYPDYFELAINLSVNDTGIAATDQAWNAVQKYRTEIAGDAQFGWFFAGAANLGGDFSAGVNTAQNAQTIGPGTGTHFRSSKSPEQAIADVEVQKGWYDYHKGITALDLKLQERGLTSLSQRGAEDLKDIRDQFVAGLKTENQSWAAEFGQQGGDKVSQFLTFAASSVNAHPELGDRADIQALAQYVQARNIIKEQLTARGLSNLTAKKADDLSAIWDTFTTQLCSENLGFSQMWSRVLSRDDLSGGDWNSGNATT